MRVPESDREPGITSPTAALRPHQAPVYAADSPIADLAAAFQEAIVEPLAVKTARAALEFGARTVVLAGVAANALLRERLRQEVLRLSRA